MTSLRTTNKNKITKPCGEYLNNKIWFSLGAEDFSSFQMRFPDFTFSLVVWLQEQQNLIHTTHQTL